MSIFYYIFKHVNINISLSYNSGVTQDRLYRASLFQTSIEFFLNEDENIKIVYTKKSHVHYQLYVHEEIVKSFGLSKNNNKLLKLKHDNNVDVCQWRERKREERGKDMMRERREKKE